MTEQLLTHSVNCEEQRPIAACPHGCCWTCMSCGYGVGQLPHIQDHCAHDWTPMHHTDDEGRHWCPTGFEWCGKCAASRHAINESCVAWGEIPGGEDRTVTLGEHLTDFKRKLYEGTDSEDGCVLCGRKQVLLHPVERAWACSDCHQPPERTEQ